MTKISRGGIFEKFSARGVYQKYHPYSRCLLISEFILGRDETYTDS